MKKLYSAARVTFCSMFLLSALFLTGSPVQADDVELDPAISQDNFNKTVRDLGVAFSYIPTEPAEAQGITGFNVGVEVSVPDLENNAYMDQAFEGSTGNAPSNLVLPKVHVSKGLPLGVDVSGFVSGDPNGNARLFGGALKYSIIDGGIVSPSVAVRGHGTQLTGVDDLDLRTYGGDVSISKGLDLPLILGISPYAGYSHFQIEGEENTGSVSLNDHDTNEGKVFAGTRISTGFVNLVLEADIGEVNVYSVRANIGL